MLDAVIDDLPLLTFARSASPLSPVLVEGTSDIRSGSLGLHYLKFVIHRAFFDLDEIGRPRLSATEYRSRSLMRRIGGIGGILPERSGLFVQ